MSSGLYAGLLLSDTVADGANGGFLSSQHHLPTNDVEKDFVSKLCLQLLEAPMKHSAKHVLLEVKDVFLSLQLRKQGQETSLGCDTSRLATEKVECPRPRVAFDVCPSLRGNAVQELTAASGRVVFMPRDLAILVQDRLAFQQQLYLRL